MDRLEIKSKSISGCPKHGVELKCLTLTRRYTMGEVQLVCSERLVRPAIQVSQRHNIAIVGDSLRVSLVDFVQRESKTWMIVRWRSIVDVSPPARFRKQRTTKHR